MESGKIVELEIDRLDYTETQTRADGLNEHAIQDYSAIQRGGGQLDPALVFQDGDKYWPATGRHRGEARRRNGEKTMPCEIRAGTKIDAILAGIEDNKRHRGVRLSLKDKQHNTRLLLRLQPDWTDNKIAAVVGVDHKTVAAHRRELEWGREFPTPDRRIGRDGREYESKRPSTPVKAEDRRAVPGAEPPREQPSNETVVATSARADFLDPQQSAQQIKLPTAKPVKELLARGQELLGKLRNVLGEANEMEAEPKFGDVVQKPLNILETTLDTWIKRLKQAA